MKIAFFGSSDFAVPVLEGLKSREEVVLVVTQPDRKKGRTLKLSSTPIKDAASKSTLKIFQPDDVNSEDSIKRLKRFKADIFVVVSFGQILRKKILDIPGLYSLNVHASLLPKYRGASPINWAIANGEKETGVTVMRMNERMDEGDVLSKKEVSIAPDEDAVSLSRKLSRAGASLLLESMESIKSNAARFIRQDDSKASYAPKLKKEDGVIDWNWDAEKICNRVRAFVPWPGCYTSLSKKILKIWKVMSISGRDFPEAKPGTVLEMSNAGILVVSGKGLVRVEELQLEGRRRMNAGEFIRGHKEIATGVALDFTEV